MRIRSAVLNVLFPLHVAIGGLASGVDAMSESSHPTYCEQIDGLLLEVQHLRLSVLDARQMFLQICDQVARETLEDYIKSENAPLPKPSQPKLIWSSH